MFTFLKTLHLSVRQFNGIVGFIQAIVDLILISLSIIISLIARLIWIIANSPEAIINYQRTLLDYSRYYIDSAWLLSLICMVMFILNGFYTQGRLYRGRYQILVIIQAVSSSYLIFGAFTYLSQGIFFDFLKNFLNLPRGAIMVSWGISTTFIIFARARIFQSIIYRIAFELQEQSEPNHEKFQQVLVIGGAGLIGTALIPQLQDQGYHVRILDSFTDHIEIPVPLKNNPQLKVLKGDFRQIDQVVNAVQGIDVVIFLGPVLFNPRNALSEDISEEINSMTVSSIASVAKTAGVKCFIFASCNSVYGTSNRIMDEFSTLKPSTEEGRCKVASENILLEMSNKSFAPVVLRFGNIYGLSDVVRLSLFINKMVADALFNGEISIDNGGQWISFVHVEDAARAIITVLNTTIDVVNGQIFNIGSDAQVYRIRQVGEIIKSLIPTVTLLIRDDKELNSCRMDFKKARRLLGFFPEWNIEQGIQQVREAILSGRIKDYQENEDNTYRKIPEAET